MLHEKPELLQPDYVKQDAAGQDMVSFPVFYRANFYGERYYYRFVRLAADAAPSVRFYNSVTSFTGTMLGDKQGLVNWAAGLGSDYGRVLAEKAAYGTLLHSFLPKLSSLGLDYTQLPEIVKEHILETTKKDPAGRQYLSNEYKAGRLLGKVEKDLYAVNTALHDLNYQPFVCEAILHSEQLQMAGAADLVGWVDMGRGQELAVIDLKTGSRRGDFHVDYQVQLALYALMWNTEYAGKQGLPPVTQILNVSPADFPASTQARKFYNLQPWDLDSSVQLAMDYYGIWERNHKADKGADKVGSRKLQTFAGFAGQRFGKDELVRTVTTYEQLLLSMYADDLAGVELPLLQLGSAEPEEPEDTSGQVDAAAYGMAALDKVEETAEELQQKFMETYRGVTSAVVQVLEAHAAEIPAPKKGRPAAERQAANVLESIAENGTYDAKALAAEIAKQPSTKVGKLTAAWLSEALALATQGKVSVEVEGEGTVEAELTPEAAQTVAKQQAEATTVETPDGTVDTSTGEIQTEPEQPPTEQQQGSGLEVAQARLTAINKELQQLSIRKFTGKLTEQDYEVQAAPLRAKRMQYLDLVDKYEAEQLAEAG